MPVCQEKRPKILVIGSINMDMVARIDHIPLPGETVLGQGYSFAPGGKGANAAVAAARLGGCVAFAGCVGDDSYGQALRKTLTDEGVDDRLLRTAQDAPTGYAPILVQAGRTASSSSPARTAAFAPRTCPPCSASPWTR